MVVKYRGIIKNTEVKSHIMGGKKKGIFLMGCNWNLLGISWDNRGSTHIELPPCPKKLCLGDEIIYLGP
jgi:hypothetical protein